MRKRKKPNVGSLVNKLERCIALANIRGDRAAAERFAKLLAAALNGTPLRDVVA